MTVDRALFATSFDKLPDWPCPTCGKGHLKVEKDALLNKETRLSKAGHAHDAWDPEWIDRRFAGLLECDFGNCGDMVAILGDVSIVEGYGYDEQTGEPTQEYSERFKPRSLSPAPLPIRPPVDTPEEVAKLLKDASGLLWQSPEGAGNQIRQAVEVLLDEQGVAKTNANGGFKKLHHRLEDFQNTDPKNAEILFAIKWLGNSGSHPGGLTRSDVLDAFDFIELVLINLYDKTTDELILKAQAINLNKGPVKLTP